MNYKQLTRFTMQEVIINDIKIAEFDNITMCLYVDTRNLNKEVRSNNVFNDVYNELKRIVTAYKSQGCAIVYVYN